MPERTHHRIFRSARLRAAVLGANDGIVSTASLVAGVASAHGEPSSVLTAGLAGLVAGSLSMAVGEYVSVKSQAETEAADLRLEARSLASDRHGELQELIDIYVARGLSPRLAHSAAVQLMAHDALDAHARDELGISPHNRAKPLQAAAWSAGSFASGAALPLAAFVAARGGAVLAWMAAGSLLSLAALGALAAHAGGAPVLRGALRVTVLGALAIALTAGIGKLFGIVV
ncbi:VIT family protein [Pigmentiphaga soli]|uniref:VIT family protein n=1 Tax=Pigmentiphaga soli TaxID=1007095 RepID=A0ABP8GBV4_9BURK